MRQDHLFLSLLCCTACGGDLEVAAARSPEADGHIMTGELRCTRCSTSYPIRDGVPRFGPPFEREDVKSTVTGFGYEWSYSEAFMQKSALSGSETFLQFIEPVQPDYFRGKLVLDGGCGSGRFTILAQRFAAKAVVGVDLSDAADVAFRSSRALPNVHIIQADLFALPLKPLSFDYVFSVGVLHHTSNPSGAFDSVVKRAKPGGGVSACVYSRENNGWIIYGLNPVRKHATSRLPRPVLLALSYAIGGPLFMLLKCLYRPVGRSRRLGWLRKVLPYFDYLYFLGQYGFREQTLVVLDHLGPALANYISRQDFAQWFERNRLQDVVITSRAGNSWRGFAVRPLDSVTGSATDRA